MNGERYLLDTNAVIQLLKGNSDFSSLLGNADSIALSIIAATARKNDLTLLTADDHFKKLKAPWKVRFYKPV